jgi:YHS domain-containing protein
MIIEGMLCDVCNKPLPQNYKIDFVDGLDVYFCSRECYKKFNEEK